MDSMILLFAASLLAVSSAYPNGPPVDSVPSICKTMTPNHYASAQEKSTNPYMIKVSSKCYLSGSTIEVEITSENQTPFKGFFVQARSSMAGNASHGMFRSNDMDQKQLSCFGKNNNAIGHSARSTKTSTKFTWVHMAGSGMNVDFMFVATVVQSKETFWTMITSEHIMHDPNCGDAPRPEPPVVAAATMYSYSVLLMIAAFVMVKLA